MDNHSSFIIDLIEDCVNRYPSNIAIVDSDNENGEAITYSDLWTRACKLSSNIYKHLNVLDNGKNMTPLVSIAMNRGIGSIVCILAVLKAGAAYVPVDPSFPADRQEYIFTHSNSQLLLVDDSSFTTVQLMGQLPPVILVDSKTGYDMNQEKDDHRISSHIITSIVQTQRPESALAYVLYTSGSTGKPKGVMVQNKGLSNIIQFFAYELKVTPADRVLGLTTLCFDISMLEVFLPLICGASLVIVSARTQKNPYRILDVIRDHKLTIVQATPTSYEMLISCDWNGDPNIHFLVGGEAIRPKVAQLALNSRSLTNVYGPTETTIWSSAYRLPNTKSDLDNLSNIPIGVPISGTYFYIVDEEMNLLPDGQEGELLIGGDGVALGYIHAPDLTEKRFFKNPYRDDLGMVYRTGDLVSKLPDGTYVFARRLDDQVKVNGYRIELGEVEVTLLKHPQISQAVVVVKNNNLVGYVVLKTTTTTSSRQSKSSSSILNYKSHAKREIKENSKKSSFLLLDDHDDDDHELTTRRTDHIKQFMTDILPKYMIPKYIMIIDEIPKTLNGKVDRLMLINFPSPISASNVDTNGETRLVTTACSTTSIDIADVHATNSDNNTNSFDNNEDHTTSTTTASTTNSSMLNFVIQKVLDITGYKPLPSESFAAVGIDSLTAVIFRVQLSKSLGSININQNILYDVNTSILSFSIDLYNQMKVEKLDSLLDTLGIKMALPITNNSDDNTFINDLNCTDDTYNNTNTNTTTASSLASDVNKFNSILLWNRKLFDGLRGMLIIFVLHDHFYSLPNQGRIGSDTFMFIVLTGFTITLQNQEFIALCHPSTITTKSNTSNNFGTATTTTTTTSSVNNNCIDERVGTTSTCTYGHHDIENHHHHHHHNEKTTSRSWNAFQFLTIRAVALFPMYWLAILLCVPRMYVELPATGISSSQFGLLMTFYVLAIQSWSCWFNPLLEDLFYVSYIWNMFLVYAIYMTIIFSINDTKKSPLILPIVLKSIGIGLITAFLLGMYYFFPVFPSPTGDICIVSKSPSTGFIFFFMGILFCIIFTYIHKYMISFQSPLQVLPTSSGVGLSSAAADHHDVEIHLENHNTTTNSRSTNNGVVNNTFYSNDSSIDDNNSNNTVYQHESITECFISKFKAFHKYLNCQQIYIHSKWMSATKGIRYAYITRFGYADMYWALTVDCLAFMFFFLMYFRFDIYGMSPGVYNDFDGFMELGGFPLYFSVLLIIISLHSHADSLFTFLLKESYIFKLLGECSLPIYLFNQLIVAFYVRTMVFSIQTNKNQFTRTNYNHSKGTTPLLIHYNILGVFITVIFSIFIQKIFQDRFVMMMYIWSLQKWKQYFHSQK